MCFLGWLIYLSALFSDICNLCSFLKLRCHISHPYKTFSKIVILYIIIFSILESRWVGNSSWPEQQQAFTECITLISSWTSFLFLSYKDSFLSPHITFCSSCANTFCPIQTITALLCNSHTFVSFWFLCACCIIDIFIMN